VTMMFADECGDSFLVEVLLLMKVKFSSDIGCVNGLR